MFNDGGGQEVVLDIGVWNGSVGPDESTRLHVTTSTLTWRATCCLVSHT